MEKTLPSLTRNFLFAAFTFFLCTTAFSQTAYMVVDGANTLVTAESKFPVWLNTGQTLAAGTNVNSLSVIQFSLSGTDLKMDGVVNVTSTQSVPTGKVWKVEAALLNPSASTPVSSGWNDDGTAIRLITATDFVGIGTSTPAAPLSVGSTSQFQVSSAGAVTATGVTSTGAITFPGLSTAGIVTNTAAGVLGTTSVLPVANGGTGSATQNWVDLTTAQTVAGAKTWSNNAVFNGNVGIGVASPAQKLSVAGTIESTSGGFKFPDGTTQTTASSLVIKKAYTALTPPITYHNITPTNTYSIPITLPPHTKGVYITVKYTHTGQGGGSTDHGYLSFLAYQQGATSSNDKTTYDAAHFADYFNTDFAELVVPWNNTGSGNNITIQVTSSYNTNSLNFYQIYFAGYIAGN